MTINRNQIFPDLLSHKVLIDGFLDFLTADSTAFDNSCSR